MIYQVERTHAVRDAMHGKDVYAFSPDGKVTNIRDILDDAIPDDAEFAEVDFDREERKTDLRRTVIPLDMGKVRALYNAGWSEAKIADEMGVAQATISRRLSGGEER